MLFSERFRARVVVHDHNKRAVTKRSSSECVMNRDNAPIENPFPRLDRPDGALVSQTEILESAQGISVAIFARDGLVYPTRIAKESLVFVLGGVEANKRMILFNGWQRGIGEYLSGNLCLLLQIFPLNI